MVNRVEKGVRDGGVLDQVFPRLANLGTTISGEGPALKVHFTKRQGAPVHFIPADDPSEAAAVREVDLQRKYYISPRQPVARNPAPDALGTMVDVRQQAHETVADLHRRASARLISGGTFVALLAMGAIGWLGYSESEHKAWAEDRAQATEVQDVLLALRGPMPKKLRRIERDSPIKEASCFPYRLPDSEWPMHGCLLTYEDGTQLEADITVIQPNGRLYAERGVRDITGQTD